jgi:hypothetical protein
VLCCVLCCAGGSTITPVLSWASSNFISPWRWVQGLANPPLLSPAPVWLSALAWVREGECSHTPSSAVVWRGCLLPCRLMPVPGGVRCHSCVTRVPPGGCDTLTAVPLRWRVAACNSLVHTCCDRCVVGGGGGGCLRRVSRQRHVCGVCISCVRCASGGWSRLCIGGNGRRA